MSEGVGARREQPPVRLETVATATGLRSPATLLRGGDAPSHPSPTPRGASPPRCRGRGVAGTPPLAVGDRHLSSPSPQPVDGGGEGQEPGGHDLAPTWLQSSQQGSWGG